LGNLQISKTFPEFETFEYFLHFREKLLLQLDFELEDFTDDLEEFRRAFARFIEEDLVTCLPCGFGFESFSVGV
jgi:hypothetical protein